MTAHLHVPRVQLHVWRPTSLPQLPLDILPRPLLLLRAPRTETRSASLRISGPSLCTAQPLVPYRNRPTLSCSVVSASLANESHKARVECDPAACAALPHLRRLNLGLQ